MILDDFVWVGTALVTPHTFLRLNWTFDTHVWH